MLLVVILILKFISWIFYNYIFFCEIFYELDIDVIFYCSFYYNVKIKIKVSFENCEVLLECILWVVNYVIDKYELWNKILKIYVSEMIS